MFRFFLNYSANNRTQTYSLNINASLCTLNYLKIYIFRENSAIKNNIDH